jgi:hypothetical protein
MAISEGVERPTGNGWAAAGTAGRVLLRDPRLNRSLSTTPCTRVVNPLALTRGGSADLAATSKQG